MRLTMSIGSIYRILIILVACAIICACGPTVVEKNKPPSNLENEALVRVNKYMVKKDADIIKSYIKRRNLSMKETDSGLWYAIIKSGSGT